MDQILSLVTLGVADLARSRRFYVDGLGWAPAMENEGVIFFDMGGCILGLFGRDALAEDMGRACEGTGAYSIAHNVADRAAVDAAIAAAEAAGATVLKRPVDVFWGGYAGYFADPDGHAWEVAWNPHWTIDEGGISRIVGAA